MTANIGSLAVSLSMDADSFNGSMAQVDRNLRAMGSELRAVRARGTEYGNSLEGLGARQDVLRRSLDASNIKLTEARRRYDEMVASGTASETQLERQANRVNQAQTQYNRLEAELNEVTQAITLQSSSWHQLSERLAPIGQRLSSIGQGMTNVGRDLSMKVTAPIVGLGTAVAKAGMDFEESMDKVAAVSGATGEDFAKLEAQAKELGTTTKFSASEAASGMQFLAMAGFKTNDILSAMPGMLDLAAAGALDLGAAADITSNIMSGFGIEASKAGHISDVLAKAASSANTDVSQLGQAMKPLAPVANTMGWSMEEATAAVMALSDAGIQGEQAGTAFATSLGRLAKPTGAMAGLIEELGISFFDAQGNMKAMPEVISEVENATEGMTAQQKSATLTTLFGAEAYKQWAILLDRGSDSLGLTKKELVEADGAAAKMAKTMSDNTKGGIKELLSALEGLAIQLSEILLPFINKIVDKITEWTRKFAALSPEAQKTILVIGGIAAAIGPLLVVIGTLVSSVGSIVSAVGAVSGALATAGGASAVFGGALAALTGPIGLTVAAVAGLTAGGIALYKHLQKDAIPEVDRFGKQVSESTKEALGGFFELSDGASQKLTELSLTQQRVTEETKNALVDQYGQMNDQVLAKMDERHTAQMEKSQNFFALSNALTQEEEEKILRAQEMRNQSEIAGQEYKEARIKEILEKASTEKRALTESEQKEINSLQQQMNENAVQYLSENEIEAKIIMERMKQSASDLSAKQAAEVVKNSNEQKDKAVKAAEEQYEQTLGEIIRMRDETGDITAEQADKMIEEADRQRNVTVMRAEETHKEVVDVAKAQAGEHIDTVNWETGEILSKWDVFWNDTKKMFKDMGDSIAKGWDEFWDGVKKGTDEAVEDIKGIWDNTMDFFKELPGKMVTIGKDIIQGLINGIGSMASAVWDKAKSIANGIGNSIKKALGIASPSKVMIGFGKNVSEGLSIGMDDMLSKVIKSANRLANAAIPNIPGVSVPDVGTGKESNNFSTSEIKGGNTINIHPGAIQISAKDVQEFNSVVDFFNRLPQVARAR